jgi:hypothetical protein
VGRIGAIGRNEKQHTFADAAAATGADKLVAESRRRAASSSVTQEARPGAKASGRRVRRDRPQVNAKPGDARREPTMSAWQVYADWLQEAGEPWGEVITRACAGKRPKKRQDEAAAAILERPDGSTVTWKHGTIEELALCPEDDPEDSDGKGESRDFPCRVHCAARSRHPAGRRFVASLGLPPEISGNINWSYDSIIR